MRMGETAAAQIMYDIAVLEAKITEYRKQHLEVLDKVRRGDAYPPDAEHSLRTLAALEDELSLLERLQRSLS